MVEGIIDDYHKAFPYVFGDHPVRPSITYEYALYYPPFDVLDVKVPPESFSKKYPLFNEFITQEVSELAADQRPFIGKLLGLSARFTESLTYRLLYRKDFSRWKKVEKALDQRYGKTERMRLVHRAYFLEGDEIIKLEEKTKEAGSSIEEAFRPIKESKGSIADDSFWDKIPGRWKDVVLRVAAGAVAYTGKVTDVTLFTLIGIVDLNAIYVGFLFAARNLPVLSTIATTPLPLLLGTNLAIIGMTTIGVMYHEMGHQMTKTLLTLNTSGSRKT
ncbi:hypothetical protein HY949_01425 [Candidatus Gottesmanbacteria bacterium]|nr:hypothetical protein [Candidatus Gottesmanbacteria bacterium]